MASRSASPVPHFPTSKQMTPIQPNAHPYAIKTTSSALLSRSNSSPHTVHPPKHHYLPPSPTRPRHRHSSSLSLVDGVSATNEVAHPAPLPTPPSFSASPTRPSFSVSNVTSPPRRTRADTLPTGSTTPMVGNTNIGILDRDLPSNPKQWSTDQLTTYLAASLRKSGELDTQSIGEVLDCVRGRGLTGRELLRLTDGDLASTPLSDVQKARLLQNSRTLRADVLRGRIWVDPPHSREISNQPRGVFPRSIHSAQSSPFHGDLYRTSISSVDLLLPRSSPFEVELPPSPTASLHRSEASVQRYRDLAHIRARRRGKVKGLVEAWEGREGPRDSISGSEYSMSEGSVSGSDVESESDADEGAGAAEQEQLPSPVGSASPVTDSIADSTIILRQPPPYNNSVTVDEEEEEPSMEELLASSASLQGARAWEADFALGETVKRVPVDPVTCDGTILEIAVSVKPISTEQGSDIRRNGVPERADDIDSKGRNNRKQKRVVTAIFTGTTSGQMAEASDEASAAGHPADIPLGGENDIAEGSQVPLVPLSEARSANELDDIIRALEVSIESTRAQLEAFRVRLEAVEFDIARHDAEQLAYHDANSLHVDGQTDVPIKDTFPFDETPPKPAIGGTLGFKLNVREIARSVLATAIGWVYPYSHPGLHARPRDARSSRSREGSRSPARRLPLPAFRISYVIFFSFALCAAVLRRVGFGRWLRGT